MPGKILLVEDNDMNRDMLSRRLERKGYEIFVALNGHEAIIKALEILPDIILMDMSLPLLNGWEASQRIKENPIVKNIPIIALTAHAMRGDREKALASGCDDYDTKPVEMTRLLSKIEEWLAKKKI